MAITRVNVAIGSEMSGGTSTIQATASATATTGNLIVVFVAGYALSGAQVVSTITDTAGNTYTKIKEVFRGGTYCHEMWYAKNITGHATNIVTVTWNLAVGYRGIVAVQYAGLDTIAPLDGFTWGVGQFISSSSLTTEAFSSPAASTVHVMIPTWALPSDVVTYPSGFSSNFSGSVDFPVVERFLSAAFSGTYTLSHTYTSQQLVTLVAAFREAPVGAFTKLQSTGRVTAANVTSTTLTFASPPTLGNTVVVAVFRYRSGGATLTCTDNRGNTYQQVVESNASTAGCFVFMSQAPLLTGSPFTITLTSSLATTYFEAVALEVIGVLGVDRFATGGSSSGTAVPAGTTAAITGPDVFVVALHCVAANQSSITVESVSPAWTQELENLNYSATIAGEINSRSLTGVAGTTQSCNWTLGTGGTSNAAIVVFGAAGSSTIARISQVPVDIAVLSDVPISARLSQLSVDVLSLPLVSARVSQVATEVMYQSPTPVSRVSQVAVEVMYTPASTQPARLSQVAVEVMYLYAPPSGGIVGPFFGSLGGNIWIEDYGRSFVSGNRVYGTYGEDVIRTNVCLYLSTGLGGRTAGRWYKTDSAYAYASSEATQIGFAKTIGTTGILGSIQVTGRVTGFVSMEEDENYYVGTTGSTGGSGPGEPGGVYPDPGANVRLVGVADSTTSLVMA